MAPTDLPEVFLGQKRACLGAGGIPQDVVSQNLCEVILHLTSCTVRHHHQTDPTECEREDHGHQLPHDSNYHTHSAKAFVTGEVSCVEREGGGGACGKSHTTLAVSVPLTCMVCVLTTSTCSQCAPYMHGVCPDHIYIRFVEGSASLLLVQTGPERATQWPRQLLCLLQPQSLWEG